MARWIRRAALGVLIVGALHGRAQAQVTLTGKLQSDMGGAGEIKQGKVEGDKVSFVEMYKFEGNEIQITYTGKITSNDEIKFTRQVADFATEELVAKRVK